MDVPSGDTDGVRSREQLVGFLRALHTRLTAGSDPAWENRTLPQYLDAAAAWIEDLPGYCRGKGEDLPEQPSWETIAQIFAAARTYE